MARSGTPWLDLPDYYPSGKTVYTRFCRWRMAGVWDNVLYMCRSQLTLKIS
ncbi:transposase [Paenibacillus sp. BAC0078]